MKKLTAIALASAFAFSSTFALASTNHHKKHHSSYAYGGSSNNRGGLVGGADNGTYGGYARSDPSPAGTTAMVGTTTGTTAVGTPITAVRIAEAGWLAAWTTARAGRNG